MHALSRLARVALTLGLAATTALGIARAQNITIPIFIEHDTWTIRCEDDPKIPGIQGFGRGYGSSNRALALGHQYRVSGSLGWSAKLTTGATTNDAPTISEIAAGPHLTKPPVIRINTADPEFKNPLEVIFGAVKEFRFVVPVDYLGWEIPDAYARRVGNRQVELPDGKWEMQGALGWSIPITVADGKITVSDTPTGLAPHAVTTSADGLTLAVPATLNRVPIDVSPLLGAYTVQTADGKPLLPAATGPQTANLPPGHYILGGSNWTADLTVTPSHATATLPPAKPAAIVAWPNGVAACRPGPYTVNTPWGGVAIPIPEPTGQPLSIGVGWSPDNSAGLSVTVAQEKDGWQIKPQFIRGGGKDWQLHAYLTTLDPSNPLQSVAAPLPLDGKTWPVPSTLTVGAYSLVVTAEPPGPADKSKTTIRAAAVVEVDGPPAASLWFAVDRTAYRADEPIEICAWQSPGTNGRLRSLQLVATAYQGKALPQREPLFLDTFSTGTGLFRLAPGTLAPGSYTVELRQAGRPVATRVVLIVPDQPASHFPIHAYGSIMQATAAQAQQLAELGVNTMLEQGGVGLANEPRATALDTGLAALSQYLPEIGPAARYNAPTESYMDVMDRLNWRMFAQWGSAHQPYGYGISFTDPGVIQRVTMAALWASQYLRQHPGFLGMNVFDEGGTTRGPHFAEDSSLAEDAMFQKNFGRPRPRYYGDDNEAGRAWIYQKQLHQQIIYSAIGKRLDEINALADPGAHLYLGTQNGNLNSMAVDSGHPPLAYQAITLSTFHWYAGYINTAFILLGNEYHFMQPKPIEFWPLIWADGHTDLTLHEVNLAISRQVDGVGHFHWPPMLNAAGQPEAERAAALKALHARLTRYGDLFRTVRRDRASEVAVLYSLYDFAPKLIPAKTHLWSAYENAYKASYTGYLAISACLRRGLQAGWVSEEEILQHNGLAGRRILVVPGMTAMMPELKTKLAAFVASGGTVFVDAGTTVDIPGAKKLATDFGAMVDQAKYNQATPDGKGSSLAIDRVVLDQVLPALQPIADLVGPHPQPGSTELLVTKQQQGQAQYFYCVNDRILPLDQLPAPLTVYKVQKYFQPITTDVALPVSGVIYDVFAGKEVARATGSAKLPVALAAGELALFAVLPEPIDKLGLGTPKSARAGEPLALTVTVLGQSGKRIDAAIPLEIKILDTAGKEVRPTEYRSTTSGHYHGQFMLGAFDPAEVRLVVKELLSGATFERTVSVNPLKVRTAVALDKDPVIVENRQAVKRFLHVQKRVIIALGDGPGAATEALVAPLVDALHHHGAAVTVRHASELDRKTFDSYIGRGLARLSSPPLGGSQGIPEVDGPVIALGSSANNRLIAVAIQEHHWTRYADRGFPGPGRGYVAFLWQPFSLTDDSLIAVGEDEAGLKKTIDWLASQVR